MVAPGVAILIASALSAAAKGASDYYGSKKEKKNIERRARETKRETKADILDKALDRGADLETHRLNSRKKLGQRGAALKHETAENIRGALNI